MPKLKKKSHAQRRATDKDVKREQRINKQDDNHEERIDQSGDQEKSHSSKHDMNSKENSSVEKGDTDISEPVQPVNNELERQERTRSLASSCDRPAACTSLSIVNRYLESKKKLETMS